MVGQKYCHTSSTYTGLSWEGILASEALKIEITNWNRLTLKLQDPKKNII